ncbi:hypothetical protein, partial [Syntrophomonas wolfei]|uniref:hypothetical protein n=1 Tax=Syntrophomonas wolfei TaxID=863 RepID=UPI0023F1D0E4
MSNELAAFSSALALSCPWCMQIWFYCKNPFLLHKGCINMQSERWRSMDETPGEGEQATGGERQ